LTLQRRTVNYIKQKIVLNLWQKKKKKKNADAAVVAVVAALIEF
jgi:hypothetical protein